MLKKLVLSLTMICVSFITGYATAQSYFINKAPALPKQTLASNEVPEKNTLSPSDFQSQTEQLEQKKNQALSDQLKQNLAKVPPTPPPAATPSSPEEVTPEAAQGTTSGGTVPSGQAPTEAVTPPGPQPATPPSQSQVYTGFQNTDQNQGQSTPPPGNNNSNQPSSSGGWNIKY